jgi:hypothetical protein
MKTSEIKEAQRLAYARAAAKQILLQQIADGAEISISTSYSRILILGDDDGDLKTQIGAVLRNSIAEDELALIELGVTEFDDDAELQSEGDIEGDIETEEAA